MRALAAIWLIMSLWASPAAAETETPRLMISYEWGDLNSRDEDIYIAGALEGFFFQLYSSLDRNKPDQVRRYNELSRCVQAERENIKISLNNSLALGRDLEESFPEIIWNRSVPLICKESRKAEGGENVPVRFVSHLDWNKFPISQKKLFLMGYLETQLYFLSKQADSIGKSENLALYKQVTTDAGQNKTIDLLVKYGLDPDLPIPWSIAKAHGSIVRRGPGYQIIPTAGSLSNRAAKEFVEGWGAWVDLEAINAVCAESWAKSNINSFKETARTELLRQKKCLAGKISDSLIPSFFNELGVPQGEIEKMRGQLNATVVKEKTLAMKQNFDSLTTKDQQKVCENSWWRISSPNNSTYFRAHQIQYNLARLPKNVKTSKLAESLVSECRISAP